MAGYLMINILKSMFDTDKNQLGEGAPKRYE